MTANRQGSNQLKNERSTDSIDITRSSGSDTRDGQQAHLSVLVLEAWGLRLEQWWNRHTDTPTHELADRQRRTVVFFSPLVLRCSVCFGFRGGAFLSFGVPILWIYIPTERPFICKYKHAIFKPAKIMQAFGALPWFSANSFLLHFLSLMIQLSFIVAQYWQNEATTTTTTTTSTRDLSERVWQILLTPPWRGWSVIIN